MKPGAESLSNNPPSVELAAIVGSCARGARRPSGAEEGEAAAWRPAWGRSSSPTSKETQSLSNFCSGSDPFCGGVASGIPWAGAGRTAFALPIPAPGGGAPEVRECSGPADAPSGAGLEGYFEAGGGACVVLCDERFQDASWIGEDAGLDCRTGLHALLDREDIGAVGILRGGEGSALEREKVVLGLAERHPGVLFVLESGSAPPSPLYSLRPNVYLLDSLRLSAGALLGHLEAADWRPALPYRRRPDVPPAGLCAQDLADLLRWRRGCGLRRSIDLGTRWVVFEPSHPLLWRSVERDVAAFLGRLERWGFFEAGRVGAAGVLVHCAPRPGPKGEAVDPSCVLLRVDLQT